MLYLAIPAHNEVATIGVLLWRIRTVLAEFPREYEVVVYDDASTDETAEVAEQYRQAMPLTVLRGRRRVGYAGAVDALVRHVARQTRYPRRDALLLLQGDFTDPPAIIPEFARRFEGGADLVVGERHGVSDAPVAVRRLFVAARWALRPFVRVRPVQDLTGSMRLVRISVLRDLLRAVGDTPVCEGDSLTANASLAKALVPHARRVEAVPVEPTYAVRMRETRRSAWRDAAAVLRWGWRSRGASVMPNASPEVPEAADRERPRRERPDRPERPERPDRPERGGSAELGERGGRGERPRRDEGGRPRGERARPADATEAPFVEAAPREERPREARERGERPRGERVREERPREERPHRERSRGERARPHRPTAPPSGAEAPQEDAPRTETRDERPKAQRPLADPFAPPAGRRSAFDRLDDIVRAPQGEAAGESVATPAEGARWTPPDWAPAASEATGAPRSADEPDPGHDAPGEPDGADGRDEAEAAGEAETPATGEERKKRRRRGRRSRKRGGGQSEGGTGDGTAEGEEEAGRSAPAPAAPRGGTDHAGDAEDGGPDASGADDGDEGGESAEGGEGGDGSDGPKRRRRGRRGRRGGARRARGRQGETGSGDAGDAGDTGGEARGAEERGDGGPREREGGRDDTPYAD